MTDIYHKLASQLDNLPAGFPATDSEVELKILKQLFTPEEAEAAMVLSLFPETTGAIAEVSVHRAPHLLCSRALEVRKYVCVPDALHLRHPVNAYR
jgi:hypothetical protein